MAIISRDKDEDECRKGWDYENLGASSLRVYDINRKFQYA
jgi:hypothetical protein